MIQLCRYNNFNILSEKEQKWETQHQKNKHYFKKGCNFSLKIHLCSLAGLINSTKKELFSYIHTLDFIFKKAFAGDWSVIFSVLGDKLHLCPAFVIHLKKSCHGRKRKLEWGKLNKNYSSKNIESHSFFLNPSKLY